MTVFCGMPAIQYSAQSARLSVRLSKWACRKITSGQSNLTLRCITAGDGWFNRIRQMAAMCPCMRAHWRHLANMIELCISPLESTTQIDRFSRFCGAQCDRLTERQTDQQTTLLSR